jgi:hypothetical protein
MFLDSKVWPVHKADNLTTSCLEDMGSLTSHSTVLYFYLGLNPSFECYIPYSMDSYVYDVTQFFCSDFVTQSLRNFRLFVKKIILPKSDEQLL